MRNLHMQADRLEDHLDDREPNDCTRARVEVQMCMYRKGVWAYDPIPPADVFITTIMECLQENYYHERCEAWVKERRKNE